MSVKSAVRVLRIFELLSVHKGGLSNKQICTYLNLPQSSASGLIKTLLDENYLSLNESNYFILGPKLIPVGQAAMESFNLSTFGVEDLKALMLKVEETVFMATLVDNELIYIAKIDSNRSIRTSAFLGGKKPLYCTGLGKAYLASMPQEKRETYIQHTKLEPITDHTITDKEELKTKLLDYQHQGYAIDDEENEEGLYCLAAPIFNSTGEMEAAISVAGPKARMLKHEAYIVQHVKNTASMISIKLGYRGG
ncbi:IclR family transcriptional regulator [Shouchella sp. 1P09AA]|uniref:IclR family transcriptional regulator n=1 Tax=unclassified Shouchella TaxID=2893065 RepID=UPI0039A24896